MNDTDNDTADRLSVERQELERTYRNTLTQLLDYLEASRSGVGPVVGFRPLRELRDLLEIEPKIRNGGLVGDALARFINLYLEHSTRLHHPRYLAHQVASVEPYAGLADLIHGIINNPMAIYEMGPAGAAVEVSVIRWMLDKVGFAEKSGGTGVLTHGGSLANCTALLAARAQAAPGAWAEGTPDDLVVLVPRVSHYCISRAVSILGLGSNAVRQIEVDALERVRPVSVKTEIERAHGEGKRVMAVVANACATSTGLHDPIRPIGELCREAGVWFHVDAAHGASALLSPRERHWLDGIELADSLVWDAHKMLRTSTLCAAVLFRDPSRFDQAFHQEASYLFYGEESESGHGVEPEEIDLISRTIECTKAELGLKVFLSLAAHGEKGLADYVSSRYRITRSFYELIRNRDGFECPYRPEANILCFRYLGPSSVTLEPSALDALQIEIRERLMRTENFHLSSTTVGKRRYLRMSVMSPHTDEGTIEALLDVIERVA